MKRYITKGYLMVISLLMALPCFCLPGDSLGVIIPKNVTLTERLSAIEKNNAHAASVIELKSILNSKRLTKEELLAVQTSLVHQYQELQLWDSCLQYCQAQITLARRQNNSLAEATFYKLIGNTYYHIPDKEKAVIYWGKTIAIGEPNGYNVLLEQCYNNIGAIYLEKGVQYDLAEKYLLKALQLGLQNHPATSSDNIRHYRLLATLYENTNQLSKAEKLYLEVIEKCKIVKDSAQLAETSMFYSLVLVKKNELDKAIRVSADALSIARNLNHLDLTNTALEFHARNLYAAGKFKDAYQFKEELEKVVKERFKGDLNTKISEAEAKFKTTEIQHEKEIAAIKAKKERQIYLFGFTILLSLSGFAFYYFHQKSNIRQKTLMLLQVQDEKERLSRDLHDNLGSQMALLSNNIENLDINYRKQQVIDKNIDGVKGVSKQLLQTLRETIWILNKEQVTAQEFFDKLVDYAHRYLQSYPGIQLKVEEQFTGNKIIHSNEALQLFRICQEAIANACKYAGSENILLYGNTKQNSFQIIIEDAGKGFDIHTIQEEGHYGLQNMKKRATSINADLQIKAEASKGVTITIKI